MIIHVTQDDIDQGERGAKKCPVARAIGRYFNGVTVGQDHLYLHGRYVGMLPKEAIIFMYCFDYCIPVEPFSFEMDIFYPEPTGRTYV